MTIFTFPRHLRRLKGFHLQHILKTILYEGKGTEKLRCNISSSFILKKIRLLVNK
jgi:hypothetical protein